MTHRCLTTVTGAAMTVCWWAVPPIALAQSPLAGGSISFEWPTFVSWLGAGALFGYLFTDKNPLRVLIAVVIALGGVTTSTYFGSVGFWWLGLLLAVALVARWWRRLRAAARIAYALIADYDKYKDRVALFVVDERWHGELDSAHHNVFRYRGIVRTLARQPRNYKIRETIITRIDTVGTSTMVRNTTVEATGETVSWIYMMYGTTAAARDGARLEPPNITDGDGRRLFYDFFEEADTQKRMIVFLNTPARAGSAQTVRSTTTRTRSWASLVESLYDHGSVDVPQEIESITMTIHVPSDLRIDDFTMEAGLGNVAYAEDRASVTWTATGLRPASPTVPARHRFELQCHRTPT